MKKTNVIATSVLADGTKRELHITTDGRFLLDDGILPLGKITPRQAVIAFLTFINSGQCDTYLDLAPLIQAV